MLAQAQTKNAKPIPATSQVFTYRTKGKYAAEILGYSVLTVRVRHNLWHVVEEDTGKIFAEGDTRQSAVREAFYNLVDAEERRLDWVLNDQPYRVYGTKPRRTKAEIEAEEKKAAEERAAAKATKDKEKAEAKAPTTAPKSTKAKTGRKAKAPVSPKRKAKAEEPQQSTSQETPMKEPTKMHVAPALDKQVAKREDDRYSFTFNETIGGHLWMRRDDEGKIEVVHGPFESEQAMLEDLMQFKVQDREATATS